MKLGKSAAAVVVSGSGRGFSFGRGGISHCYSGGFGGSFVLLARGQRGLTSDLRVCVCVCV